MDPDDPLYDLLHESDDSIEEISPKSSIKEECTSISSDEEVEEIDLTKMNETIEEMTAQRTKLTEKLLDLRKKEEKARRTQKVTINLAKAEDQEESK